MPNPEHDPTTEDAEQIAIAARVVLGLVRSLVENPGSVEMKALPWLLLEAAEERHRADAVRLGGYAAGLGVKVAERLRDD